MKRIGIQYSVVTRRTVRMLVLGSALLFSGVVLSDPPSWAGNPHDRNDDRGYAPSEHEHHHGRRPTHGHFYVSSREQMYINDWYRRHRPHGLVKKGRVPPGLAKKVYRGSAWPPPYPYRQLPPDLVRGLQPLPSGYHYFEVNGAVVIADVAGKVVSDVVYDLLTQH